MTATQGDLRESDLRSAIGVLQSLTEERAGSRSFVVAALDRLTRVVPSELTTLSMCDLEHGSRRVVGRTGETLSDADRAAFDRHFREHPLVRFHGSNPGGPTRRISDCMDGADFRNSAPHALSLLKRFFPDGASEREIRLPAMLSEWFSCSRNWGLERPAITCGQEFTVSRLGAKLTVHFVADPEDASAGFLLMKSERTGLSARQLAQLSLTKREREILAAVAADKTNAEIAIILAISSRTVQKHLEHIFQKLGVETRTAAAVHALAAADAYAASDDGPA